MKKSFPHCSHCYRNTYTLLPMALLLLTLLGAVPSVPNYAAPLQFTPRNLDVTLNGVGTAYPEAAYQELLKKYKGVANNTTIRYQALDSVIGIQDFLDGDAEFAGINLLPTTNEHDDEFLSVPMMLVPIAIIYNVPGEDDANVPLNLSPDTLERILRGNITTWDDKSIQDDNPGKTLPKNLDIRLVHRSDECGASFILTSYLAAINNNSWEEKRIFETPATNKVGVDEWRKVLQEVEHTSGAIGYIEYRVNDNTSTTIPIARIQNRYSKHWIMPTIYSTMRAAQPTVFQEHDDLRITLVDSKVDRAYPIVGISWLLLHQKTYDTLNAARALTDFIAWSLEPDQLTIQRNLGYAPLHNDVIPFSLQKLCSIQVENENAIHEDVNCP